MIWYHMISYHMISYQITSYHMISYHMISYHMISYHIIWYDIIWYDITWYRIIWYNMISYHMISYHIIWYDMISYHIAAAAAAAAAASRYNGDRKLCFRNFTQKNDHQKIIQKRKTQENSVHVRCWIITRFFSRGSFDYFPFLRKIYFFERARNSCEHPPFCCRGVTLERSNTVKTHTKWPVISVPAPGLPSTGPKFTARTPTG